MAEFAGEGKEGEGGEEQGAQLSVEEEGAAWGSMMRGLGPTVHCLLGKELLLIAYTKKKGKET
jgi:hypothetical protein